MLFSSQASTSAQDTSIGRQLLLADLLVVFRNAFPNIRYQIIPELNLLNGQALILRAERLVRLYGGMALHPAMGRDGLAFALLHETGHHLAAGARLPWNPLLACECLADCWALNSGLKMVADSSGWTVSILEALSEIDGLLADEPDISRKRNGDPNACWARHWSDRRAAILAGRSTPAGRTCRLNNEVLDTSLNPDQ
jgi:hypothetical protein